MPAYFSENTEAVAYTLSDTEHKTSETKANIELDYEDM